ncbi:hypothetical protein KY290_007168 [Solanum tuberosum]|uniref:Uncharacterized protein n=1 Tax=Solanum tuberosum TaxID=4113 RepID=A0ABQ7W7F4_SOLTU|nr:hypothetical protein KY290_007168 [Solanum tuberosum]
MTNKDRLESCMGDDMASLGIKLHQCLEYMSYHLSYKVMFGTSRQLIAFSNFHHHILTFKCNTE